MLGSGSTGNAVLLDGRHPLLVDCGFTARDLQRRCRGAGFDAARLEGVLVTHEHADHARGAPRLAEELEIPILGTAGTLAALPEGDYEAVPLEPGARQAFHDLDVRLFRVDHDAAEPAGVRLGHEGRSFGLLTDAGAVTPAIVDSLRGCDTLIVESNHDPDLLRHGPYPEALQRRIRGGRGHLSNDQCAQLLGQVSTRETERILLHHLSRTNNTPELALATNHVLLERTGRLPRHLAAAPAEGPFGPFPF